ncbi:MAG: hypothetical protein EA425_11035 [Puniceicoccaceae bacterium]|nr:MAG: hypothetical protein EA425_11035 [Puniceicoccaceae bacterium]
MKSMMRIGRFSVLLVLASAVPPLVAETLLDTDTATAPAPAEALAAAPEGVAGGVIYPRPTPGGALAAPAGPGLLGLVFPIIGYFIILAGLGVVVWHLVRRGGFKRAFDKSEGRLHVTETRMLGNRQFLLVVDYDGQKVLLGVVPGRIDYLCALNESTSFEEVRPSTREEPLAAVLGR